MIVFPTTGNGFIFLQYSGDYIDSAKSLDASILSPPTDKYIHFSAGTTGMVANASIIGGTSSATAKVNNVVITSGTLAGGDAAGIIFLRDVVGTWTLGEDITVAGPSTIGVARSAVLNVPGQQARSVFLQCETNSLRIDWSGKIPTNSAATPASHGVLFQANENMEITGNNNLTNLKFINAVSTSNGVLNVIVSY